MYSLQPGSSLLTRSPVVTHPCGACFSNQCRTQLVWLELEFQHCWRQNDTCVKADANVWLGGTSMSSLNSYTEMFDTLGSTCFKLAAFWAPQLWLKQKGVAAHDFLLLGVWMKYMWTSILISLIDPWLTCCSCSVCFCVVCLMFVYVPVHAEALRFS